MPDPNTHSDESLIKLLEDMSGFTAQLQTDIACSLLSDDKIKDKVNEHNNQSEEKIMQRLNSVLYSFASTCPLAALNMTNLFMAIISYHSQITGNPKISNILKDIEQRKTK